MSQAINVAAASFWKGLLPYIHLARFLRAALPVIAIFSGAAFSKNESINIVSAADVCHGTGWSLQASHLWDASMGQEPEPTLNILTREQGPQPHSHGTGVGRGPSVQPEPAGIRICLH